MRSRDEILSEDEWEIVRWLAQRGPDCRTACDEEMAMVQIPSVSTSTIGLFRVIG